ncbi:MAG: helix-turn-helix domain-containing protein [Planctomycetota bacterium]|nr:MAG: helix-turn-helix domain-containing protein [Planctomycetota bacterium]
MSDELEVAIQVSEAAVGLPVVVHDLVHVLWNHLPDTRFRHHQALCQQVKTGAQGNHCLRLECGDCRAEAWQWPQGRVQRCHAGFSELVQPVMSRGEVVFMIFAGPAVLEDGAALSHDYLQPPSAAWQPAGWQDLPRLAAEDLPRQREHLRQLAARLRCWYEDQPHAQQQRAARPRRQTIEALIHSRHSEALTLQDLAADLGLSRERCRHVVREVLGMSFSQALRRARLQAACALLLNSDLPVSEIGSRCGYPDPSGFSRHFRAAQGMSPGRWRAQHRG